MTTYCICNSAHKTRFSGGYLATPYTDVIEISLKFEKIFDESFSVNNIKHKNNNDDDLAFERCNLNFVELSDKTLKDLYNNELVHDCVRELLNSILLKKQKSDETYNTSQDANETPLITTTDVTIHQQSAILNNFNNNNNNKNDDTMDNNNELKVMQRNSSKRSSMKSCKSMETVLEKITSRPKDKSPDETKAKSVGNINDDDEDGVEDLENGESIELIFISDEFVNRVQKQEQEVIIVDDKDGKRRNSLTNKKKIVIITDQYKEKVLRNNSIVLTNDKKKMLNKKGSKKAKTYNTNSNCFLPYDEDERYENFEIKKLDNVDVENKDLSPN